MGISRNIPFLLENKGQMLIEYVSILVLIAVVVVLMLTGIGGTTNNFYSSANSAFTGH